MQSSEIPLYERFKSGFKISFKHNKPNVSRVAILKALAKLKPKIVEEVRIITKHEHNNSWLIILNDEADCSELSEKSIIVEEKENNYLATIRPLKEEYLYRKYKLSWNPFEDKTIIQKIFERIDKRIEIREVEFEKCKEEGLEKIYSGNTTILVRVKKAIKDEVIINDGMVEVEGTKMYLSRIGGPVRCHKCGELGHFLSECKMSEDSYKDRLMRMRSDRFVEQRKSETERKENERMKKEEEEAKSKIRDEKMVEMKEKEQNYFRLNGDVQRARWHGTNEDEEEGEAMQMSKKYKEEKAAREAEKLRTDMSIKYFQI